MRETEEIERFGLSFATTLSVVSGEPPKLDQACFVGVQFQGKLVETFPQVCVKLFGIRSVFEAQHNVVSEAHHVLMRLVEDEAKRRQAEDSLLYLMA